MLAKITSNDLLSFNTGFILKSSCKCQKLKMVGKTSMALNLSNTRNLQQKLALKDSAYSAKISVRSQKKIVYDFVMRCCYCSMCR